MNEAMQLALVLLAGMLLGAMFFGGLWWTVQRGLVSPRPALWFIGSLLLRTGLALAGFYLVAGSDWRRMVACLAGFVLVRIIILRIAPPAFDLHAALKVRDPLGAEAPVESSGRAPADAVAESQLPEEPNRAP